MARRDPRREHPPELTGACAGWGWRGGVSDGFSDGFRREAAGCDQGIPRLPDPPYLAQ